MENERKHSTDSIDSKVTKRHYPRTNNSSVLEFVFEKDPNLFLRKNKIVIRGAIECDAGYVVENGFVLEGESIVKIACHDDTKYTKFEFLIK